MGMFDKYNDSVMFNNPCPPGCETCCPLDIQLAYDPITNVLTLTYIYDNATVVRTVNLTDLQEPLTIGLSFDPVTNIITLAGTYNGVPFTSNVDTTHNHDLELILDGTSIVLTGEHDGVQVQTSVDISSLLGGNLSLSQVLINGNTSGSNDIVFDLGQGILFNNGSRLREGTIDALLGGQKGIAQICAVGYELKWEAGRLYVMDGNGIYIRWSLYNFTIVPTINDDVSLGYLPGSRWTLDDGSVYLCTDSTLGAAVWVLQSSSVPTLEQVLASGNSAGNQAIGDLDTLAFNLATTNSVGEGEMIWNDVDGTVDLGLKGGNTILNVGQQNIVRIVNKTTPLVPLTQAGYEAVVVAGATGQRLSVKLAKGDNDLNSAGTLGLVCEDIAVNQEGFITTVGVIKNINTTGSLQGETWADGDVLYLSPFTFGAITNIKPTAPNHTVIIGYVEYAHINNGKIFVKVDNGYELDELHNVKIDSSTLANNNILAYTSATQVWENKTPASVLGFTPAVSEGWNVLVKTANHDVTNTIIPQDDPELQFSVVANGSYMVEMDFCWSGNNATSDYQGNFNVTAGLMTGYGLIFSSYNTSPIILVSNNATSPAFGNFQLVSASITFLMSCKVQFNFTCTQNATFKYQLRNAIAGAGWTSRTWKGTILKYKRID